MKIRRRQPDPRYALRVGCNVPVEIVDSKTGIAGVQVFGFSKLHPAPLFFEAVAIANKILHRLNKGGLSGKV
jgi:hypothetical protein